MLTSKHWPKYFIGVSLAIILILVTFVWLWPKQQEPLIKLSEQPSPASIEPINTDDDDLSVNVDICGQKRMAELDSLPILAKFEDYSVNEKFNQKPAPLDLESSFIARRFYTNITSTIAREGVNFAGHYTIATSGFTGVGTVLMMVDATNGRVYPFPYVARGNFSYRVDSNLLIMDSLDYWRARFEEDSSFLCMTQYLDGVSTWKNVD